ncbi:MAG: 1-(5-phosphoribosyl)-5-[(5-phosphoribosylamino)methylideneamino] imidazole-4-carboxamide isomerase [Firmicutes bacterium]|jgi:phosphoribosylformimino-5-aminoimidazole carboxamide ribotide isomerase|nr:1-(5-phosphoribosyl)-5-[(5-phosphoribosylamino)methylideneamino] imidazole-4-carboxamide isomerase [Bacillota bacterium]
MFLIPAMDISNNRVVRLYQGDFEQETNYGDPGRIAETLLVAGVKRVHLVDLDAARGAPTDNYPLVIKLCDYFHQFDIKVEFGGGIRDAKRAEVLYEAGVDYLILGTMVVVERENALSLIEAYPGRIIVGLDYRRSAMQSTTAQGSMAAFEAGTSHGENQIMEVMIKGWLDGSSLGVEDILRDLEDLPLEAILLTDVARDGTMTGPDLAGYKKILAATDQRVIASGGVSSLGDLGDLTGLLIGEKSLYGVVVGKALLGGSIDLTEAVSICGA